MRNKDEVALFLVVVCDVYPPHFSLPIDMFMSKDIQLYFGFACAHRLSANETDADDDILTSGMNTRSSPASRLPVGWVRVSRVSECD